MNYDRGEPDVYEIVWRNGHTERVIAHQALMPTSDAFAGIFGGPPRERRWTFHGEVDGRWRLLLSIADEDVLTVRNVTQTEDREPA